MPIVLLDALQLDLDLVIGMSLFVPSIDNCLSKVLHVCSCSDNVVVGASLG